jgi:hypothetical protein
MTHMVDLDKVLALIAAMNDEGVEYITFGAIAMGAHGLPRATEDADFFVRAEHENIERLKRAICKVWEDPEVENITNDDLSGDYPAVRYGPPDENFTIDFLSRLGEAFSYETLQWQVSNLEGVPIRVVTPGQLYEMKKDTVRYKDRIDAEALRRKFSLKEG